MTPRGHNKEQPPRFVILRQPGVSTPHLTVTAKKGRQIGDIACFTARPQLGRWWLWPPRLPPWISFVSTMPRLIERWASPVGLRIVPAWCSGGWREGRPQLGGILDNWLGFHSDRPADKITHVEIEVGSPTLVSSDRPGTIRPICDRAGRFWPLPYEDRPRSFVTRSSLRERLHATVPAWPRGVSQRYSAAPASMTRSAGAPSGRSASIVMCSGRTSRGRTRRASRR
jgi:hypothetical protein